MEGASSHVLIRFFTLIKTASTTFLSSCLFPCLAHEVMTQTTFIRKSSGIVFYLVDSIIMYLFKHAIGLPKTRYMKYQWRGGTIGSVAEALRWNTALDSMEGAQNDAVRFDDFASPSHY